MKIKHTFTPSHKILACAIVAVSLVLAPGCAASKNTEISASVQDAYQQETGISGFRDQAWGTDQADVEASVIASGMEKGADYDTGEESGYYMISLQNAEVGGYNAAAAYVFQDNKLSFGVYQLDMDDNIFSDLLQKLTDKYGEPSAYTTDSGWGSCALWIDASKNYICISAFMDSIIYSSAGSSYTDQLSDTLSQYQGIDLKELLNRYGNTSGV